MKKSRNIPLSINSELLYEIDEVAKEMHESRSLVMRQALRLGLPIVICKQKQQAREVAKRAGERKP